jgi:hypothetical protein
VIEPRKVSSRGREASPRGGHEGKADACHGPEGRSAGRARARAQDPTGVEARGRSPPGSLGHWGEPAVSWSPGRHGGPAINGPSGCGGFALRPSPDGTPRTYRSRQGTRDASDTRRVPRGAVCAAHTPEAGGERRPKGPTGGQATPGLTRRRTDRRERPCAHHPSHQHSSALLRKPPTSTVGCSQPGPICSTTTCCVRPTATRGTPGRRGAMG